MPLLCHIQEKRLFIPAYVRLQLVHVSDDVITLGVVERDHIGRSTRGPMRTGGKGDRDIPDEHAS